ncbi:hypothetical protein CSAL01_00393 [Colletotrichum salicis]|uniref:DUF7587 domain-containing protein n=1 Tax=Colletotrichum salicis TaxID=1209931 RepID=A0A135SFW6_9PEZI|nr:hypothetical protein CSAL01_00393 [Colletotrichum salicis]
MAGKTDSHTPKRSSSGRVRFTPGPSQVDATSALKKIPRYLFRVHTPSTSGETSLESVVSRAALCGHCRAERDIFSIPPGEAAEMLNCHLRGWARDGDNLMSWTSSLLFALQYALYRSILPKGFASNALLHPRRRLRPTSALPALSRRDVSERKTNGHFQLSGRHQVVSLCGLSGEDRKVETVELIDWQLTVRRTALNLL